MTTSSSESALILRTTLILFLMRSLLARICRVGHFRISRSTCYPRSYTRVQTAHREPLPDGYSWSDAPHTPPQCLPLFGIRCNYVGSLRSIKLLSFILSLSIQAFKHVGAAFVILSLQGHALFPHVFVPPSRCSVARFHCFAAPLVLYLLRAQLLASCHFIRSHQFGSRSLRPLFSASLLFFTRCFTVTAPLNLPHILKKECPPLYGCPFSISCALPWWRRLARCFQGVIFSGHDSVGAVTTAKAPEVFSLNASNY